MRLRKDLTGQRFTRLRVLGVAGKRARKTLWRAACDCGAEVFAVAGELLRGATRSCGCLTSELLSAARTSHGETGSPTYRVWCSMHARCKSRHPRFKPLYMDKGITVCTRWNSYENFVLDMGHKPKRLTLERVRNSEGYSPDNCVWATAKTQSNNRDTSRRVILGDEVLTVEEIALLLGLPWTSRYYHVDRLIAAEFLKGVPE